MERLLNSTQTADAYFGFAELDTEITIPDLSVHAPE